MNKQALEKYLGRRISEQEFGQLITEANRYRRIVEAKARGRKYIQW